MGLKLCTLCEWQEDRGMAMSVRMVRVGLIRGGEGRGGSIGDWEEAGVGEGGGDHRGEGGGVVGQYQLE